MRFGPYGSIAQLSPRSEGYVLVRAGLLQTSGEDWEIDIQPTPLLRSLFTTMPKLEELYPVLVEFVMVFRYLDNPRFRGPRKDSPAANQYGDDGRWVDDAQNRDRVCGRAGMVTRFDA
jgi:hypothetical protein